MDNLPGNPESRCNALSDEFHCVRPWRHSGSHVSASGACWPNPPVKKGRPKFQGWQTIVRDRVPEDSA